MAEYYLGLMSGTSVDGIDAVLVNLESGSVAIEYAHTISWPATLGQEILNTIEYPDDMSLQQLGELDAALGEQFADTALQTITAAGLTCDQVVAIGSHGQTLFHSPQGNPAFSMQLGDANRIAERTGITTVADFRRRDLAAGGQGAPLVPAFHRALFRTLGRTRAVVNIGGMANLTVLPGDQTTVTGFDTGPGNVLLDAWFQKHRNTHFDHNGDWGRSGSLDQPLLEQLLNHPYFGQSPPKSTGRETFCLHWLETVLGDTAGTRSPQDIQRTLTEVTARSIANAVHQSAPEADQLLVCGGGIHNRLLMERLEALVPDCVVESTEAHGLHPDWVEACAFAWLAKQTLEGQTGNLPGVTGARHEVVLGAIYPGRPG